MPGKKTGRKAGGGADSETLPFHTYFNIALVGGSTTITVSPNVTLSQRMTTEADAWAHFRVRSLAFRLHPVTRTGDQLVGFVGGIQDTIPTTRSQVGELIPSTVLGLLATMPTEWVHPSKSEIAGPFPWYKALPGTADPTEESPGQICVVGTGTDSFTLEIRGVFEFKTSVATANTPLAVAARASIREERVRAQIANERRILSKILTSSVSGPTQ